VLSLSLLSFWPPAVYDRANYETARAARIKADNDSTAATRTDFSAPRNEEPDFVTSFDRLCRQPKRDHGVRGDNRNVLPAVHFIGHRTGLTATLERRIEYLLAGPGLEGIEVDADALKHEIAACRKVPDVVVRGSSVYHAQRAVCRIAYA
jgi:hypothetical protein